MIKLSYRFSVLIILIIIIIITLCFCKYRDEYFMDMSNINLMPRLRFDNEDYISLLHKKNDNVESRVFREFRKTTIKKSNNFYYSNIKIYNESDLKNGFIFQPFNLLDNISVGFHHFGNKDIDNTKVISDLDFSYKINEKNLKIYENGEEQIIDFCKDPNIRLCLSDKVFIISDKHYLGMVIHNSKVHYVIINRIGNSIQGILIHKSNKPINYPINMCIINKKQNNIFKDILWLSSSLSSPIEYPWSIDYEKKNNYEAKPLPEKKPLDREIEEEIITPSPSDNEIDPFLKLPGWAKKIEILNVNRNEDIITMKLKFHKIDQLYLNNMYQINAKIWMKYDNDKNKNKNKLLIPLKKDSLKLKESIIDNIKIDISNYGNIFYKKKIKIQVVGLISQFANDKFNLNSNIVSL